MPNMTVAKQVHLEIEVAIAKGNWREVKKEIEGEPERKLTVADLADLYLQDYCRVRNKDQQFKKNAVEVIKGILGDVPVQLFRRTHAHQLAAIRSREVAPATVNRNLSVLKNMFTFALERDLVDVHPLARFRMLPEEERAMRGMTLKEERALVEALSQLDVTEAAYVALLGETGLRKEEGRSLRWEQIDFKNRMLSVEHTKSKRPRYIPLSDYAIAWLRRLVRVIGCPYVFVNIHTGDRLKDPRKSFNKAKEAAGVDWVKGFHDLRHFRATQWVRSGVDLRTVKELLGHSAIQTTMRYAHFSPAAFEQVRQAQARETSGRQVGDTEAPEHDKAEGE